MGTGWYRPAWVEDMDLTIHSGPALMLWMFYRGAGCNITPVAKRIVYFQNFNPWIFFSRRVRRTVSNPIMHTPRIQHQAAKHVTLAVRQPSTFKFHTLSYSDGSNVPNVWQPNSEVMVHYASAVVPRRTALNQSPHCKEICYSHVIPRNTPPHTLQELIGQDVTVQGRSGLMTPFDPVSPHRTISMQTADGRHHPMVETQIYSVYPVKTRSSPFLQTDDDEDQPDNQTQATQTYNNRSPLPRGNQVYSVMVNTNESLSMFENRANTSTYLDDNKSPSENTIGMAAGECISHYWNAPEYTINALQIGPSYPELPSIQDFPSTAAKPPNPPNCRICEPGGVNNNRLEGPSSSRQSQRRNNPMQNDIFIYSQTSTQDGGRGFRNAVAQTDAPQVSRDRNADVQNRIRGSDRNQRNDEPFFQLPMFYFYHY